MKIEKDTVAILGGVIGGQTTGAPLAMRIENRDWDNWRERWSAGDLPRLTIPRPGHADYAGMVKYGLNDARPVLERASARETAARVAVGAVAKQLLAAFEAYVGSYVAAIGHATATIPPLKPQELWAEAEKSDVRCPDEKAAATMRQAIDRAREAGDSLGGIFVIEAIGLPIGLGSHTQWDRRLDGRLAAAVMSIQAIKGVEIGPAFENAQCPGTQVHDGLWPDGSGGIKRTTNRAGGLEGGMTNGQPVVVRAAMKPIPTTISPQPSVDLESGAATETEYQRSDVCAVPAASIVGEAMVAWVLADALLDRIGGDNLRDMRR
jgi:chorismate synthase